MGADRRRQRARHGARDGDDRDLCLGQITGDGMTPRCIDEPKFNDRPVDPLGARRQVDPRLRRPPARRVRHRSAGVQEGVLDRPEGLGQGQLATDTSKPSEGVLDAALSPDGKRMALVSNQGGGPFQLYLAKPGDFLLTSAKPTDVRACKVAWRSDGEELVVVQADEICQESVGSLVRLPVNEPEANRPRSAPTATTRCSSR